MPSAIVRMSAMVAGMSDLRGRPGASRRPRRVLPPGLYSESSIAPTRLSTEVPNPQNTTSETPVSSAAVAPVVARCAASSMALSSALCGNPNAMTRMPIEIASLVATQQYLSKPHLVVISSAIPVSDAAKLAHGSRVMSKAAISS